MTNDKIIEVCEALRDDLLDNGFVPLQLADFLYTEKLNPVLNCIEMGNHCLYMLDQIPGFMEEERYHKIARWIGFVQGFVFFSGIFSINELKEMSRPT